MNETRHLSIGRSGRAALILIFLIGAALRFLDFSNPPLDFHPARQLHSALIARGFYLADGGTLPGWGAAEREEARIRGEQELWIEPPVMEYISAKLYALAGDADLRLPRALAILFWLIGAAGLNRICRGWLSDVGRAAAFALYLLLPYGVLVSRSFQPEALMTALTIFALATLGDWTERRSWGAAILTAVFAGAAVYVKQVMIFPIGFALGFAVLSTCGSIRKAFASAQVWLMALMTVGPAAAYNVWGVWIDGFLRQQYQGRFVFSEWFSVGFYIRWLREIDAVFGVGLIAAALIGLALIRRPGLRWIWVGYLVGYAAYGFALPHHIGTHDYYQTPLFPLASVGLGAFADSVGTVAARIERARGRDWLGRTMIAGAIALGCGWMIVDTATRLGRTDFRDAPERYRRIAERYDPYPNQINIVGLMDDYGAGLMYWGLRTAMIWDGSVEALPAAEADRVLRETMNNRQYFIATDMERFYQQPRLQQWLQAHGELMEREEGALVFRIDNGDDAPEERTNEAF